MKKVSKNKVTGSKFVMAALAAAMVMVGTASNAAADVDAAKCQESMDEFAKDLIYGVFEENVVAGKVAALKTIIEAPTDQRDQQVLALYPIKFSTMSVNFNNNIWTACHPKQIQYEDKFSRLFTNALTNAAQDSVKAQATALVQWRELLVKDTDLSDTFWQQLVTTIHGVYQEKLKSGTLVPPMPEFGKKKN